MIDRISSVQGVGASVRRPAAADAAQQSFRTQLLARQQESQSIAFSKHARQRAEQRGIQVDDELMDQLSNTVEKAQAKGATISSRSTPPGPLSSTSPTGGSSRPCPPRR